ncbi:hypothetical protein [Paracidovorax valerianellae]|uniref:Lipoprotein n=1 Tax=Paracidovorax valerianellae TaxID=187868 RepID=A0A1G6XUZ5_9BURK|nr:hypothetical protein [Paracidovorax valerianellae]MDA8443548.1 hypothetical protein [Paracidovorax valerianellae]SDD81245.1 hypothetical protein SAMN05192589_109101 [Paracidovorax valerianellae]
MANRAARVSKRCPWAAAGWRRAGIALFPLLALAGCEGRDDLAVSGCLPLRAPARVVLLQEAGLYQMRDASTLVLSAHPRDTSNDSFHGMRRVRTLPPGTPLEIKRLEQAWGFDVGKGRISAFGTAPQGESFEYGWGGGTQIGRAPWEPASVPNLRAVQCGD